MAKSEKTDNVEQIPDYLSPEWNDFVMSQFAEDELINGYPVVAGLRRLAEKYIGTIVTSVPIQIDPVQAVGIGRATVSYSVTFLNKDGLHLTYGDVADVWPGNVDEPFAPFAVAVAATRAEARALRKALKLKTLAAEELCSKVAKVSDEIISTDMISDNQLGFIDKLCEKHNISVFKFINGGERTYRSVNQIPKATASKMIKELNKFQNQPEDIPAEIKGYVSNWQENFI